MIHEGAHKDLFLVIKSKKHTKKEKLDKKLPKRGKHMYNSLKQKYFML